MEKSLVSIVAGLAAATFMAPAVQAADLPFDSPWEGFYAGVHAEYLWGEPVVTGVLETESEDFDGFAGGLTGGYNHVFDQILLGVEADIALSEADGIANSTTVGEGVTADLDWLSTIRGRIGFVHEEFLFFVTGGVAMGGLEAEVFGSSSGYDLDKTAMGYAVGGGAEWAISDRMTVKAEYLYIDLAEEDLSLSFIFDSVGLETSLVRFGVNWQF